MYTDEEKWADKHQIKTNYEVMREKMGDFAIDNMEIRNINDMADLISRRFHYTRCSYCIKLFHCDNTTSVDNCKEWIAEWLGQEAE